MVVSANENGDGNQYAVGLGEGLDLRQDSHRIRAIDLRQWAVAGFAG